MPERPTAVESETGPDVGAEIEKYFQESYDSWKEPTPEEQQKYPDRVETLGAYLEMAKAKNFYDPVNISGKSLDSIYDALKKEVKERESKIEQDEKQGKSVNPQYLEDYKKEKEFFEYLKENAPVEDEREQVLGGEAEKEASEIDTNIEAEKTKEIETKSKRDQDDKKALQEEIRKNVREDLRKNPVKLTPEEEADISRKVVKEQVDTILEDLSKKDLSDEMKEKYQDRSAVAKVREEMLSNMVENKVLQESEKKNFCTRAAFYQLLSKGYDAGGIRLANAAEVMREALWGVPILQQIRFFREYAATGAGEMMIMPRLDGTKRVVSYRDLEQQMRASDSDFELGFRGAQFVAELEAKDKKEQAYIQEQVVERLGQKVGAAEQAELDKTMPKRKKKAGKSEEKEQKQEMSEEEREEKIRRAAILWKKTFEIDKALRKKRKNFDNFKYKKIKKGGEEELFEGEEAKKATKRDKNAFSKELMALAEEISGVKFKEKAKEIKLKWKKRDLERFITDEVKATLEKEGIKFIEDEPKIKIVRRTGKKRSSEQIEEMQKLREEAKQEMKKNKSGLQGYKMGQEITLKMPIRQGRKTYYRLEKGWKFLGVEKQKGQDAVVLEKDGKRASMTIDLFLKTQTEDTLKDSPEKLTEKLPDFPGLHPSEQSVKNKQRKKIIETTTGAPKAGKLKRKKGKELKSFRKFVVRSKK